jgi:hypothetical protein
VAVARLTRMAALTRQRPPSLVDQYPGEYVMVIRRGFAAVYRKGRVVRSVDINQAPPTADKDQQTKILNDPRERNRVYLFQFMRLFREYETQAKSAGLRLWLETDDQPTVAKQDEREDEREADD